MGNRRSAGKFAYGFSDRSGFRYDYEDLVEEIRQGRRTGLRVGRDEIDPDHPQNWLGRLDKYEDAQVLEFPRPDLSEPESRSMGSWDPVGIGNLVMASGVGEVTVT